ncbi:hypothetical protein [Haloarchaeobius iranensis]|uniref:Uncharacterized protein n=1 Tax=Haloarchaeobius iranensis TaxID=996166 RepID=A0A1G9WGM5_9EURY|nr:hypothetical protein [Haloarchaeobius iranensis]SDM83630.1 hypothetical protein SAMN05192554_10860 [Haloarchaeobius iranensis]
MDENFSESLRRIKIETRVQYGLMFLFGSLSLVAAFAPLGELTKIAVVAMLFGFTAGLWVSHLIQLVQRAVADGTTGQ